MSDESSRTKTGRPPKLRKLILAAVAVYILVCAAAIYDLRLLPTALRDYRTASTQHPFSVIDGIEIVAWAICFVLAVVGLVGIWRGSRSGRFTYLASWVLFLVLATTSGPTVSSAPSMALTTLFNLISGAILYSSFFSNDSG